MKSRFSYIIRYYSFWLIIFILQKLLFMSFNFRESVNLTFGDWLSVLWHGLRLDISAGAYLLAIPVAGMSVLSFSETKYTRQFLLVYNYVFLFIVLYLGIVDMDLYSYWGYKLDATPLVYLKTPKEAAASLNFAEIGMLIFLLGILYLFFLAVYKRFVLIPLKSSGKKYPLFSPAGLLTLLILLIPMRGGIGIAPVNPGSVYFHTNRFANHSAVNVLWNAVYSIVEGKSLNTTHNFMEQENAEKYFRIFYPGETKNKKLIKENSNVILIILESFSNKIIGELGGEKGITPELDRICRNSVVFNNFYASGERSEKGMLCLYSGYPAQPSTTIINFPNKTQSLPFLTSPFHDKGYYTAFYYGGDLNFANFRSYFTNPWMDRIISSSAFPSSLSTQKWGIPDEFLFERLISDIDTIQKPFFISAFTLSSHEPYDIPMEPVFNQNNRDAYSKNSFYYTDKCLGAFYDRSRNSEWWDNTLIIIVADHGSRYPGNTQSHVPEKFHIPMIWTGGAVVIKDTIISKISSQTDLPRTLHNQFGYPSGHYPFSKDILDDNSESFAFYFFNNGFGYVSDSTVAIYDLNIDKFISSSDSLSIDSYNPLKSYLQVLSTDFQSR